MYKIRTVLLVSILFLCCTSFSENTASFKDDQLRHIRVQDAFDMYEIDLQVRMLLKGIDENKLEIYIRAFKQEQTVEVWGKNSGDEAFQMLGDYKFCNFSGRLGPKREQGDKQIPEGFYHLSKFNPESKFHLSLKLNYPNASDSILGNKNNYGGLIFIHGGCATIGCVPITDEKISELYVLAVMAKDAGQTSIPIHVFPARFNKANILSLEKSDYDRSTKDFWKTMHRAYTYFEQQAKLPEIWVDDEGKYRYKIN